MWWVSGHSKIEFGVSNTPQFWSILWLVDGFYGVLRSFYCFWKLATSAFRSFLNCSFMSVHIHFLVYSYRPIVICKALQHPVQLNRSRPIFHITNSQCTEIVWRPSSAFPQTSSWLQWVGLWKRKRSDGEEERKGRGGWTPQFLKRGCAPAYSKFILYCIM